MSASLVGSEMCIRDRPGATQRGRNLAWGEVRRSDGALRGYAVGARTAVREGRPRGRRERTAVAALVIEGP
eukprot:12996314-Alexandrium_andersonii.AAC.1